jgi:phosphate transport system protein
VQHLAVTGGRYKCIMVMHLEATLQRDISLIRGKVQEMAQRCEQALNTCVKALQESNRQLAYSVILRDRHIDELEKQIDRLCLEFIIRQQPVATHLRFVYSTIKINAELERIGDYAESIARQILKLSKYDTKAFHPQYLEIANLSIPMLHAAVQAFLDENAELARKSMAIEDEVDVLRNKINRELLRAHTENKLPIEALTPLLTVARRLERVSDQAKNICEEVLYICTGESYKHQGSEVFRILFVDADNGARSQIAEAIAGSLTPSNLVFGSAGIEAKPADQQTLNFLKDKGMDVKRASSKSIQQVPNLEHYQVIVALDPEVKKAIPATPNKIITLEWSIKDPSKTQGSPAEVRAAYEETFRYIQEHVEDLAEAILGDNNE